MHDDHASMGSLKLAIKIKITANKIAFDNIHIKIIRNN